MLGVIIRPNERGLLIEVCSSFSVSMNLKATCILSTICSLVFGFLWYLHTSSEHRATKLTEYNILFYSCLCVSMSVCVEIDLLTSSQYLCQ